MLDITSLIASELHVSPTQVAAAVALLDEGATVPFIARYRKEATQGLDDVQLRQLEDRLGYLRELESRRGVILNSIDEQGKLDDALKAKIHAAATKAELEDLYLPYKPKRRTKAQIAREAGLEPLAHGLLENPEQEPEQAVAAFVNAEQGVPDAAAALEGARQILMEEFAEDAELIGELRESLWQSGVLKSALADGKETEGAKFRDYFEYSEPLAKIPSHRALALFRGRNDGILHLTLEPNEEASHDGFIARVAGHFGLAQRGRAADDWLLETARRAWKIKLFLHLDLELKMRLREDAEEEAIRVFGDNLQDILLSAPAGSVSVLGLDPGIRTGVKVAVVDGTGQVLDTDTVYPFQPRNQFDQSIERLATLIRTHKVGLIAIGNGTASRETDQLAAELLKRHSDLNAQRVIVSEAGASVYSASELASQELPDLDVSLRGAVSIARRLQDPLAELVKIDPKSIGVGQYQHDVSQVRLGRQLDNVVEDCVNSVGVDVNTASPALLQRVAGLNRSQAENVVLHRNRHGRFATRKQLLDVSGLGARTFEQAAGFLRVVGGENPLDASAVHPEAYPVVERIISSTGKNIQELMGNTALLRSLKPTGFTDEKFGVPTVTDILSELDKPGRDPRGEFRTAQFLEGVTEVKDLKPDMILEGTVTNVTNFGAFVDVGVHQDGLVHISHLADRFIKDPREVVKAGQTVKVKVLEVDIERQRIALTMRLADKPEQRGDSASVPSKAERNNARKHSPKKGQREQGRQGMGSLGAALANAMKKK